MTRAIVILSFLMLATACGEMNAVSDQSALNAVNAGKKVSPSDSTRPSCEVDYDEYALSANVLGFEITGKQGAKIGFNFGKVLKLITLGFTAESGQMNMAMAIADTIKPDESISYVTGAGKMSKKEFTFEIGISYIGLGYDYFKQTPMADLTMKTVKDSLKNLEASLDAIGSHWRSKVAYVNDATVVIPTGTTSGIKLGDKFNIYNVDYLWSDKQKPCSSDLLFVTPTSDKPIAVAVVTDVENNASLLHIETRNSDEPILIGARVEINQLVGTPKEVAVRKLSRAARIDLVVSQPIVGNDNVKMDLVVPVTEQIHAAMSEFHFHPKN